MNIVTGVFKRADTFLNFGYFPPHVISCKHYYLESKYTNSAIKMLRLPPARSGISVEHLNMDQAARYSVSRHSMHNSLIGSCYFRRKLISIALFGIDSRKSVLFTCNVARANREDAAYRESYASTNRNRLYRLLYNI